MDEKRLQEIEAALKDDAKLPFVIELQDDIRELIAEVARLRRILGHILWIKDCGIDGADEQGTLRNFPAEERDAMYRIAADAVRPTSATPTRIV